MIAGKEVTSVTLAARPMARNDVAVKLDAQVARQAKMVAADRGITLAEYISEILRPVVQRDAQALAENLLKETRAPRKPKGE